MRNDTDVELRDGAASGQMVASAPPIADLVEQLNERPAGEAAEVLAGLPSPRAVDALDHPEFEQAADVLALLPPEQAASLVTDMSADRATDLLADLDEAPREAILGHVDAGTRAQLRTLLTYPSDTAGGMMTTEFVAVPDTFTVAQTLAHIRSIERTRETIYAIYVLDDRSRTLVATVSLRRLVVAEPEQRITELPTIHPPITVAPGLDREAVARTISRHDLLAVPVVDEAGHVLGIVTVDDVIDAIIEEGTEDAQKFGGMEALTEPYLQIGFLEMIKKRAGWLCVLFLSEMLTASAMQHYEVELERAIVLTLFIPLIMSSGGNSGSQATSLLIRALALGQVRLRDWWRVALRELPAGVTLGVILGVLGMARITVWHFAGFYDYGPFWMLIALTVGLGLVGIVTFGSLAGSMLPFLLQRLGFDPASASAPFVATLVDVTGLIIYFSVATLVLRGTLL